MPWAERIHWTGDAFGLPSYDKPPRYGDVNQAKLTGGMVALYPRPDDAQRLAIPGGEPVDQLHCTLAFLGDDLTGQSPESLVNEISSLCDTYSVVTARIMGHAVFNPDGGDPDDEREMSPCAVYLVGDTDELPELHTDVLQAATHSAGFMLPRQHLPYIPHLTAGYGLDPSALSYTGPVLFDRLGVAFGQQTHFLPLLGATVAPYTA